MDGKENQPYIGDHDPEFSQKIMHSRVMAQGGVLLILMSVMGLKAFMDRNGGRYSDDEDKKV